MGSRRSRQSPDMRLWQRAKSYFTGSAAFNLAKTLRDDHESEKLAARIAQAKTEKILREYGEVSS